MTSTGDSPVERPAGPKRARRRSSAKAKSLALPATLAFLKDYIAPAFAIIGPLLFAVLRLAYFFFYQRLRTTPEEVGYGYTRILSESVVGTFELLLIIFVLVVLVRLASRAVSDFFLRFTDPFAKSKSRRRMDERTVMDRSVLQAVAIAAGLLILIYPWLGWRQGVLAQRGQTVRNVYFIGVPYLPVLAVQAVPARVSWINSEDEKSFSLASRNCLLYLGNSATSEGTSIFYDVRSRESIRVPAARVIVSLLYTYSVEPDACTPRKAE